MPLPVTLLSGFLGSGKTTLLQHILRNKENLRCAVIVNDMAELNIDAELVKKNSVLQKEEKLLEMQNGCICCTLREDLLVEVANLAKDNKFDYLIIESTGISEPMQVAETFTFSVGDETIMVEGEAQPLSTLQSLARLDTCVTVIDALNFFEVFNSPDRDERTLTELMCDQIEFSNVIILNKVDLVKDPKQVEEITKIVKKFNPDAEVYPASYSSIDLKKILNTGKFDFAKAANAPGWLKSLREEVKSEIEEYGVSSFVYRRRAPFQPNRLWELLSDNYMIQQAEPDEEDDEMEDEEDAQQSASEEDEDEDCAMNDDEYQQWLNAIRSNRAKKENPFGCILRSKGFMWLADRNTVHGEWSQAGLVASMRCGGPWFSEIPREAWPQESVDAILKDFEGNSDRRQEVVFIGRMTKEQQEKIIQALDSCLLKTGEAEEDEEQENFFPWPTAADYVADVDDHDHENHSH